MTSIFDEFKQSPKNKLKITKSVICAYFGFLAGLIIGELLCGGWGISPVAYAIGIIGAILGSGYGLKASPEAIALLTSVIHGFLTTLFFRQAPLISGLVIILYLIIIVRLILCGLKSKEIDRKILRWTFTIIFSLSFLGTMSVDSRAFLITFILITIPPVGPTLLYWMIREK